MAPVVLIAPMVAALLLAVPAVARADADADDVPEARPLRFSIGGGGAALLTGAGGERWRGLAEIDLYPGGRAGQLGATLAVRSLILDPFADAGLVTAGLALEAAAARPRLILALHGDVGVTFGGETRPAIGAGLKTHFGIIGPLAVATDVTAHLIVNDVDDATFVLGAGLLVALIK